MDRSESFDSLPDDDRKVESNSTLHRRDKENPNPSGGDAGDRQPLLTNNDDDDDVPPPTPPPLHANSGVGPRHPTTPLTSNRSAAGFEALPFGETNLKVTSSGNSNNNSNGTPPQRDSNNNNNSNYHNSNGPTPPTSSNRMVVATSSAMYLQSQPVATTATTTQSFDRPPLSSPRSSGVGVGNTANTSSSLAGGPSSHTSTEMCASPPHQHQQNNNNNNNNSDRNNSSYGYSTLGGGNAHHHHQHHSQQQQPQHHEHHHASSNGTAILNINRGTINMGSGNNNNPSSNNIHHHQQHGAYVPPTIGNNNHHNHHQQPSSAAPSSTATSLFFNNGVASNLHAFGNSRPSCRGRCLCAQDFTSSAVVFVMIFTFAALFVYTWFDFGYRIELVDERYYNGGGSGTVTGPPPSTSGLNGYEKCNGDFRTYLLPPIVLMLLAAIAIIAMFATVATNPGVLLKQVGKNARNHKPPAGHIDYIELNGIQVLMPYCETCNIIRPPRSSHCLKCNNCVDTFDHHCGLIGACVGKKNFRQFLIFLYSMIAMGVWSLIWSIFLGWVIFPTDDTVSKVFCVVVAIASALELCLISFMGQHYCKLVAKGYTQREYIKKEKLYPAGKNPYDDGCWKNWMEVCGLNNL